MTIDRGRGQTADPGDLDTLLAEIRACRRCADRLPLGPRPVLQAHAEASILIAGQAPGKKVHASGIPFDDASGDRLRAWLGMTREVFYDAATVAIVPMAFCYPGTGRSGDLPPRPECAEAWRSLVLAALPRVELTVVVGQYAHAYHADDSHRGLTDAVRAWREAWPRRIVLPHPSPRNNRWLKRNPWFEAEVLPAVQARVREVLAGR